MKMFKTVLLSIIVFLGHRINTQAQGCFNTNSGTEFWVSFSERQVGAASFDVIVSSSVTTTGTVSIPGGTFSQNFTLAAGAFEVINVPNDQAGLLNSELITNQGILIESADPISVSAYTSEPTRLESSVVYPVEGLGDEYIALAYEDPTNTSFASFPYMIIIAIEDNTLVDITPSINTEGGAIAGSVVSVTLNRGETYLVRPADPAGNDFTGSIIESNGKRVAVFTGNADTFIGCDEFFDPLFEQIPPRDLGVTTSTYIVSPFRNNNNSLIRIAAYEDNTTITIDGIVVTSINRGEFFEQEFNDTDAHCVTTDKAVVAAQFMKSQNCNGAGIGDPTMTILVPFEQNIDEGSFNAYSNVSGFGTINFDLNIVVLTANTANVTLDGTPVTGFTPVPSCPLYSQGTVPVANGAHILETAFGFTATVYGTAGSSATSYTVGNSQVQSEFFPCEFLVTSDDVVLCQGTELMMPARVLASEGNLTFSWSPVTGLNDPTILNPTINTNTVGSTTYTLTVTDERNPTTIIDDTTAFTEVEVTVELCPTAPTTCLFPDTAQINLENLSFESGLKPWTSCSSSEFGGVTLASNPSGLTFNESATDGTDYAVLSYQETSPTSITQLLDTILFAGKTYGLSFDYVGLVSLSGIYNFTLEVFGGNSANCATNELLFSINNQPSDEVWKNSGEFFITPTQDWSYLTFRASYVSGAPPASFPVIVGSVGIDDIILSPVGTVNSNPCPLSITPSNMLIDCEETIIEFSVSGDINGDIYEWYSKESGAEPGDQLITSSIGNNLSSSVQINLISEISGVSPNRIFTVYLSNSNWPSGTPRVRVDINETCTPCNNSPHSAEITYNHPTLEEAIEGCSEAEVLVTLSSFPNVSRTVNFTIAGTAVNGDDFTSLSNTLTILPGNTTARISIDALTDILNEGNETVSLTFETLNLCPELMDTTVTVVLSDNNIPEVTGISLTCDQTTLQAQADAGSVGNFGWYTAEIGGTLLANSTDDNLSGVFNVTDITETSGAKPNRVFTVFVQDTDQQCGRRRVDIPEFCVPCTAPYSAEVSYANPFTNVGVEGCHDAFIDVSLSSTTASDSVVSFSLTGTADNGTDYASIPTSVTILSGRNTGRITINALRDVLDEVPETVVLSFNTPNLCPDRMDTSVTVTLADNNLPEVTGLSLTCDQATLQAQADGGSVGNFGWYTAEVGGTLLANSTDDNLSGVFNVSDITETSGVKPNRVFTVFVEDTDQQCGRRRVDIPEFCVPCTVPYSAEVSYENSKLNQAIEGCSKAYIDISLDKNVVSDSIVSFTLSGSAKAGLDYESIGNSATIFSGTNTARITVNVFEDIESEGLETIVLSFNTPSLCPGLNDTTVSINLFDFEEIPAGDNELGCDQVLIQTFVLATGNFTWYAMPEEPGIELAESVDSTPSTPYSILDIAEVEGVAPNRVFTVYVERTGLPCYRTPVEIPEVCISDSIIDVTPIDTVILPLADIKAPNVFTPNGDGENDVFRIIGLERTPDSRVYIYNRWGVEIYSAENYPANEWDGGDVPDGVYYYLLEYEDLSKEQKSYTGVIHVVR